MSMQQAVPASLARTAQVYVNANVQYLSDQAAFGRADLWRAAPMRGTGDCEDFALAKRAILLEAGAPLRLVRLALCRTEADEMHAVLIVTTDEGDLVLDNCHAQAMRRHELPYQWLAIEQEGQWSPIA